MSERKAIVEALVLLTVIDFDDTDNTAHHAIYKVGSMYPGDRLYSLMVATETTQLLLNINCTVTIHGFSLNLV